MWRLKHKNSIFGPWLTNQESIWAKVQYLGTRMFVPVLNNDPTLGWQKTAAPTRNSQQAIYRKRAKMVGIPEIIDFYLVGGIPTPVKNMKVNWGYYSQLNGKIIQMFQTTNQFTSDVQKRNAPKGA